MIEYTLYYGENIALNLRSTRTSNLARTCQLANATRDKAQRRTRHTTHPFPFGSFAMINHRFRICDRVFVLKMVAVAFEFAECRMHLTHRHTRFATPFNRLCTRPANIIFDSTFFVCAPRQWVCVCALCWNKNYFRSDSTIIFARRSPLGMQKPHNHTEKQKHSVDLKIAQKPANGRNEKQSCLHTKQRNSLHWQCDSAARMHSRSAV